MNGSTPPPPMLSSYPSGIWAQVGALQSNALPRLLYPHRYPALASHSQSKLPSNAEKHLRYADTGIHHQDKGP